MKKVYKYLHINLRENHINYHSNHIQLQLIFDDQLSHHRIKKLVERSLIHLDI
jgi:hypothetical protein